MAYKVTQDGLTVGIIRGKATVGGREVDIAASAVARAGTVYRDDQLPERLRERIDAGEVKGLERVDDSEAEAPAPAEPEQYDPSKHNVQEVLDYLAGADEAEVARVKAAEAEGQDRQTIAAFDGGDDS